MLKNKKQIYESIMKDVSKTVKKHLHENNYLDNLIDLSDLSQLSKNEIYRIIKIIMDSDFDCECDPNKGNNIHKYITILPYFDYNDEDIYKESISEYELILTFEAYYNVDYHEGYTSNDRDVEPEREYLEYKDFEIYNIKLINKTNNSISITDEEIGDYIYNKFEASSYHDEFIQYAIEDDIDPYREDYYDRGW